MKIKLDAINKEVTISEAKELWEELKELFGDTTISYPSVFDRIEPYYVQPFTTLEQKYGPTPILSHEEE